MRHDPARVRECVEGLQIGAGERLAREHARRDDTFPFEHHVAFVVEIAIEHQHAGLAVLPVQRCDHIEEWHLTVARQIPSQPAPLDGIGLRLHREIEHAAARVLQRPRVRVVDALAQHRRLVRHQWRDDIHDLRQAANAHALGLPQQRVDETTDQQRVFKVVDLLEQLRRERPVAVGVRAAARTIPDVPLVKRQP